MNNIKIFESDLPSDLDLSKHIASVSNADKKDGDDGAIIIKLKKL